MRLKAVKVDNRYEDIEIEKKDFKCSKCRSA